MKYVYILFISIIITACGKEEKPARKADRQCNCGKELLQVAQGKIPLSTNKTERQKDWSAIYRARLTMIDCLSQEGEILHSEMKMGSKNAATNSYEGEMYQSLNKKCPELVTILDYLETLPQDISQ